MEKAVWGRRKLVIGSSAQKGSLQIPETRVSLNETGRVLEGSLTGGPASTLPLQLGIQGTKPLLSPRLHTVGTSPHHRGLSACCQLPLPDVPHPLFSLCCPASASLVICGFKIDRQGRNVAQLLSCYQPCLQPQIFRILPLQQEEPLNLGWSVLY